MDKKQAQQLIHQLFTQAFDSDRYQHFLRNLLNHFEPRDGHYTGNYIPDAFKQHVNQYWRIGKYVDPEGDELDLLVVEVKSLSKLERARSALRNFAVNRLKQFEKEASLIAFYAQDDAGADWRFSFVKIEHEAYKDDKGKVKLKQELTPARRYSYLVGVHENSHTACKQLLPVLTMDYADPRIEEIEAAFSIEKITDEFFDQYKALFQKLAEHLKKQRYFKKAAEEETDQEVSRFAKKLLGQIVFLYFLQKKGWLGAAQGQKWGEGAKRFLRERYDRVAKAGGNYYRDFLQYLFYEALACERKEQDDPGYYPRFACRIPFLNGGLFEADYDWQNETIDIPNSLFNNDEKTKAGDTGTGILDVFDRYNFTIKEDEPLDKEVAVDPEMLGKVFENMLEVTERKRKGAFYTPREIVHYMCQESLIHYLDNRLNSYATTYQDVDSPQTSLFGNEGRKGQLKLTEEHQDILVPKEDLETLIRKGHLALENDTRVLSKGKETETYKFQLSEPVRKHAKEIDAALADIKVCDPAIGSGAFPVGLLHEIVNARMALAPHSGNSKSAYDLKRHAIAESICGVDIDASAIDIARLRLWLSLIVDEEDYGTIEALPNLDYKIVRGDSLIGFPENWQSPAFDKIEDLKKQFFAETDHDKKTALKTLIDEEIQQRLAGSKKTFGYQVDFDFRLFFSEVWHQKGGFDVVIGNPPFISHDRLSSGHKKSLKILFKIYDPYADVYCYFLEKAISLQNTVGISAFITSNSYLRANYGQPLRNLIRSKNAILELINIEDSQLFKEAIVNTSITISTNKNNNNIALIVNAAIELSKSIFSFICDNSFFYSQKDFDRSSWILVRPQHLKALHDVCKNKPTLESLDAKIRLGIATGDNNAFIISEEKKLEFIKSSKSNAKIIKPIIRGREIERYCHDEPKNYIILAKNGIDIEKEYPDIYKYFDSLGDKFKRRGAQGRHWSNLRACSFFDDFKNEKLMWIELSDRGRFAYSDKELYLLNTAYFLIPPESLNAKYLLGVLNSSVIQFVLICTAETSGMGTLRWFNTHVKDFPIVISKPHFQNCIQRLVEYLLIICQEKIFSSLVRTYLEELIDGLVYELYFPDEIKAASKEILPHLGELTPITKAMSEEEKLAIIQREFDRLYDPRHPVRNHLETLDSVEVVRTIREALKR